MPHALHAEQADLQDELLNLGVNSAYAKKGICVQACSNAKQVGTGRVFTWLSSSSAITT